MLLPVEGRGAGVPIRALASGRAFGRRHSCSGIRSMMGACQLERSPLPTNPDPNESSTPQAAELVTLIYDELRELATSFMRRERPDHTLQPTAVVHEMYLRLVDQEKVEWNGRVHFRAVAAIAIRRFLVDYARRSLSEKRGAAWSRVTFSPDLFGTSVEPERMLAVDTALERLRKLDKRQARVVELRYFGGLSIDETADVLEISPRSVDGDWRMARSWLRRELESEGEGR